MINSQREYLMFDMCFINKLKKCVLNKFVKMFVNKFVNNFVNKLKKIIFYIFYIFNNIKNVNYTKNIKKIDIFIYKINYIYHKCYYINIFN